jgi:iron(III)-enterobactin esterase
MAKSTETKKKRVTFRVEAMPGSRVFVAGTFNEWSATATPLDDKKGVGLFTKSLYLPAGRHEYKFVIGSEWVVDPACAEWTSNNLGTLNSVLVVA